MVDIFRARTGKRIVVINNADIFLDGAEVRVVSIEEPQSIEINFDRLRTKRVSVKNRARFITEKGYVRVGKPVLKPTRVVVKGPSRNIARIESVFTESAVIEGLENDTVAVVRIARPSGYKVSCSPQVVSIAVNVQKIVQRELKDIPVHLINVSRNVKALLDTAEVTLTIVGGEKVVANFTPNDLNVFVDYRKFMVDTVNEVSPTIVKFKEVKCVSISPRLFRLSQNVEVK
ncbi:unnamed protein product [marine sediment metagenome]|uniref:Uncharacterized protein n=1 Tax=marine sediment metagenome TaxID=412755 RepID=X0T0C9_9ZZZZ